MSDGTTPQQFDSGEMKTLQKVAAKVQTAGVILALLGSLIAAVAAVAIYVGVGLSARPTWAEVRGAIKDARKAIKDSTVSRSDHTQLKTRVDISERANQERYGDLKKELSGIKQKLEDIADRLPRRRHR